MGIGCSTTECPKSKDCPIYTVEKIKAALNCEDNNIDKCWEASQKKSRFWEAAAKAAAKEQAKRVFDKDLPESIVDEMIKNATNFAGEHSFTRDGAIMTIFNSINQDSDDEEAVKAGDENLKKMCELRKLGQYDISAVNPYLDFLGCAPQKASQMVRPRQRTRRRRRAHW